MKTMVTKTCPNCHNEFIRVSGNANQQVCCSPVCARQWRVAKERGDIHISIPDSFGHWFAGLTDGEGCFGLNRNNGRYMTTRFSIGLRADETPVLNYIQETLGFGQVYVARDLTGRSPAAQFSVSSIGGCQSLVEIFHKYPLRAKKARDFEIWAEAVGQLSNGESLNVVRLRELALLLREHRLYRSP